MIKLTVNGETREFSGDQNMPLLWFLRDLLGRTGTKYGCGKALCCSCTVHLDGQAIRSCSVARQRLERASISSIEGVGADGDHPLQIAWAEHNVPQCGYCQSGQIMQAAALLAENPYPKEQEIADGMNGVICRCGTYQRIRAAIKWAAEEDI